MKTSKAGITLICSWEGFSPKPYLCPAKVPTIGYGSTRYADGHAVTMADPPISLDTAQKLFADNLPQYERAVERAVKMPLQQHEFDALVSLCYNIGADAFAKSTLVKLLNKNKRTEAAAQFLLWNKANGIVLKGLVDRRAAEKKMFEGV